ncbi:MAG: transketolase family protein [Candidatus Omnitrophica bacterium]|nr:transketolase family protein [Candidatus Omnitrophota bacterium]MBU2043982.1 transketolase family protein [Candidatus Omnitrophota bacterium]MBU2251234.1 transketolase family protein [Candidatus Omnitrophota bacterium]MBU2265696.1 transketolase family protein [Candidatus Omnitrophota bacterium]
MDKVYARDVYGQTLVELGQKDKDLVVLDADLSGSTRTAIFQKAFPDRFFNFGVAEQNMMATAAGLASSGKVVFASTFAMFATARALDQVRNSICSNNFNVKIVATHGGITVGEDGASHQALEDINFFRAIPNMKIIVPADGPQTREAVICAYKNKGPFYIRLGRSKISSLENKANFIFGKGQSLKEGKDLAIIACGIMVQEALAASAILEKEGIFAAVVNLHSLKPLDEDLLVNLAKNYKTILVCEEHQVTGGLFSAVAETLIRKAPVKVERIGIENVFGQSGSPKELMEFYGLSADCIAKKAKKIFRQ